MTQMNEGEVTVRIDATSGDLVVTTTAPMPYASPLPFLPRFRVEERIAVPADAGPGSAFYGHSQDSEEGGQ